MPYAPPHPLQSHPPSPDDHAGHEHPPHLAHHWDTPVQQFEAGKLGMWLFLATEVLLFGGLFCAYAVWRGNHPELFKYGSQFLDTSLGATNTAVLILSSLTMAWAVTASQQNKRGLLILMLSLTLAGAATFLVIKYFEYTHKFHEGWYPGIKFYDVPSTYSHTFWAEGDAHNSAEATPSLPETPGGAVHPPTASVHAPASETATSTGHAPTQPANQDGFQLETLAVTPGGRAATPPVEAPTFQPAQPGPSGLAAEPVLDMKPFEFEQRHHEATVHPLRDPERPRNAHMFFNIYFMMTGLHGVHVVIGMIVIMWLLVRAIKGHFSAEYFTPVDLGGLYWHIVDLIWIFLFPLFYLI
jgi:cytochrome c oxidase subunit III